MSPSMVCTNCGRFLRVKKNGVFVEELQDETRPYKLWAADLWSCPECGIEVVSGFGAHPIAEWYEQEYQDKVTKMPPMVRVAR